MKILIMVDMEGISGIVNSDQVRFDERCYNEGRQYTTWDVNACVRGCIEGGATEIIVRDTHHTGKNFIWHELDPSAEYVIGRTFGSGKDWLIPGIEGCNGLIMLGHHAMAGTEGAILEHTFSSINWRNLWVNGKLTGEIGIEARCAAEYGVPAIMVSGDDKACAEASELIPGIVTAQVKTGYTRTGAKLLPLSKAHELIRQKAAEAVRKCAEMKPVTVEYPVELKWECNRKINDFQKPGLLNCKFISEYMCEVTGNSFIDAFTRLVTID